MIARSVTRERFAPDVEVRVRSHRIGVIGAGMIVADVHLEAYRQAGFPVHAIASRTPDRAREVAERYGIEIVHETPRVLIEDPAVEIVDIAFPPDQQPALIRHALAQPHVKAILATGDIVTLDNVAKASMVCMMAGADFIKTSTGKEGVNATIPVSLVMVRAIRDYYEQTGFQVGYKPAGGVSTAKAALQYLTVMKEELGNDWLQPHLFRIGASSLMTDIERQLEHYVTGNYSAAHRHAQP